MGGSLLLRIPEATPPAAETAGGIASAIAAIV
jgi:hypothetical protein